jgi:hypothetical protein
VVNNLSPEKIEFAPAKNNRACSASLRSLRPAESRTTAAGSSRIYGMQLLSSDYPDLIGKLVWYGIWRRATDGTTAYAVPYCKQQTFFADSGMASDTWIFSAVSFIWPTPTPDPDDVEFVDCGIYKTGTAETGVIYFTAPMLMEVGVPLDTALGTIPYLQKQWWGTAAPTTGTWARGDSVLNSTPSAAGPPGWVCTTAGTPGTWKARANLL